MLNLDRETRSSLAIVGGSYSLRTSPSKMMTEGQGFIYLQASHPMLYDS